MDDFGKERSASTSRRAHAGPFSNPLEKLIAKIIILFLLHRSRKYPKIGTKTMLGML